MPRYWVIAPIERKKVALFNKVWQIDFANDVISVGWSRLKDVSRMSREKIRETVERKYHDKPRATCGLFANMLWTFYHEIERGDFVIARKGRRTLAAIGRVTVPGKYDTKRNSSLGMPEVVTHPNFLQVKWQESPRDRTYATNVFPMPTICELSKCKQLSEDQRRTIQDECGGSLTLPAEEADRKYIPQKGDRRKLINRQIRERRGQQQFREALCRRYANRCVMTACDVLAVLEAAHIRPYRGENDNDPGNGLLLRADIHTLFDLNLIGIEPDRLQVELHPDLAKDEEYRKLAGMTLACASHHQPSRVALKLRYEEFKKG
jgi:hypothetical protein